MQTNDPDKQPEPLPQTEATNSPPSEGDEDNLVTQVEEIVHQMSHPTTAILALSQLLVRNESLDQDIFDDIQTIAEQALLLKKLIRELQVTLGDKRNARPF